MDKGPLIFLHGGNHGSWCWQPLLVELAPRLDERRVILLDMPGCGTKRHRHGANLTLADISTQLNDELRKAGVEHGVLIGHSIAGALMPVLIAEDPQLFSSAIFLATCAPLEGQTVSAMMGASRHGDDPDAVGFPLDPATAPLDEQLRAMFCDDMAEDVIEWLLSEIALDTTPDALMIEPVTRAGFEGRLPATYILTLRDRILPVEWQRRFAERLGCSKLIEIDTPHEPFISHPAYLAATLLALI